MRAGVDYSDWIKYSLPLMVILMLVGGAFIAVLAAMAWVG